MSLFPVFFRIQRSGKIKSKTYRKSPKSVREFSRLRKRKVKEKLAKKFWITDGNPCKSATRTEVSFDSREKKESFSNDANRLTFKGAKVKI